MLTTEQNERYTQVGPGTPMGELMRRYWHPIAAVSQMHGGHGGHREAERSGTPSMTNRSTRKIRLLGEDLILYKDRSGTLGLIEPHCAHRRMSLIYGIPEEHGIRCPYHGWMYDETGQCIEQPYEETEEALVSRSDSQSGSSEAVIKHFKDKIKMRAYPVQEKAGMIFAYLGPEPAPLLPNWDLFAMEGVVRDIGYALVPCNYLQVMENSLDPVHVEWLHQEWYNYVVEQQGKTNLKRLRQAHAKIGFDVFDHGIVKRRMLVGETEEDDDWAIGHPVVFPLMLRQGTVHRRGGAGFQIRVPVDDTHTAHWWYRCYTKKDGEPDQRPEEIPLYSVPVPQADDEGVIPWDLLDNNSGQDLAAWITQGGVADRSGENLGRSDRGVILYRKLLDDNLRTVEDGGEPMNVFRDPAANVYIDLPTEDNFLAGAANQGNRPLTGASTKYSPILRERAQAGTR